MVEGVQSGTAAPFSSVDIEHLSVSDPGPAVTVPVVLGPRGLNVRVTASVTATPKLDFLSGNWWASGQCQVRVRFTAGANGLDTHLAPCGPVLTGQMLQPQTGGLSLDLRITGAAGQLVLGAATFWVFGLTRRHFPIPPLGCALGTEDLIVIPANVSPLGDASLFASVEYPLPPGTFHLQCVSTAWELQRGRVWRTSNLLSVTVR